MYSAAISEARLSFMTPVRPAAMLRQELVMVGSIALLKSEVAISVAGNKFDLTQKEKKSAEKKLGASRPRQHVERVT